MEYGEGIAFTFRSQKVADAKHLAGLEKKARPTYQDKDRRQKRCNICTATQASFKGFVEFLIYACNEERAHTEFKLLTIATIAGFGGRYEPCILRWANGASQGVSGRDEK